MNKLMAAVLVLSLGAIGCEKRLTEPQVANRVQVEGETVAPGGFLLVRHRNTFGVAFGVNECSRGLERRVGDEWVPLPPELRMCPGALQVLQPGEETTWHLDVPTDAADGTYRFTLRAYAVNEALDPANQVITTAAFEVRK